MHRKELSTPAPFTGLHRTALLVGIWLVPGLLQCVQEATYAGSHGNGDVPVLRILLHFLPSWLPWVVFTPAVLALTRRFPLERNTLPRVVPIHIAACIAFGVTHLVLLGLVRTHFPPAPWTPRELGPWLARTLWSLHAQAEVLAYTGVVLAGQALRALKAARERELRAAGLEARLLDARLSALRVQLQPHFLFNTLNAIDVLIVEDREKAGEMLRRLADLLRLTLEDSTPEHSLGRELEHVNCYLGIERVRFCDRLEVVIDIDEAILGLAVPSLLLQPLVENALRHGIAPRARGGRITISARCDEEWLELMVEGEGVGLQESSMEGIGVGNTGARLLGMYGDHQEFRLQRGSAGGTQALIRIPARNWKEGSRD